MIPQCSETGNKIICDMYFDISISGLSVHDTRTFMEQTQEILERVGFKLKPFFYMSIDL